MPIESNGRAAPWPELVYRVARRCWVWCVALCTSATCKLAQMGPGCGEWDQVHLQVAEKTARGRKKAGKIPGLPGFGHQVLHRQPEVILRIHHRHVQLFWDNKGDSNSVEEAQVWAFFH
jgi:hypothetical protein